MWQREARLMAIQCSTWSRCTGKILIIYSDSGSMRRHRNQNQIKWIQWPWVVRSNTARRPASTGMFAPLNPTWVQSSREHIWMY